MDTPINNYADKLNELLKYIAVKGDIFFFIKICWERLFRLVVISKVNIEKNGVRASIMILYVLPDEYLDSDVQFKICTTFLLTGRNRGICEGRIGECGR